jgi:hypothetical protein
MALSKSASKSKRKTLAKVFPVIGDLLERAVSDSRVAAKLETVELLMDVEQATYLLASLDDFRQGHIVHADTAFGDL